MTKRLCATGLLALVLLVGAPSAARAVARPADRTVVLVLAPWLSWEDVASGYMPETARLAHDGAVANMNVRSLLPDAGQPSAEAGALMLSAGTWARHDAAAAPPAETSGTPAIRFPGLPAERAANAGEDADIRLGALGEAIGRAGGITVALGNADGGGVFSRPAAIVAMDAAGEVATGDVSPRMTRTANTADAAFGLISDEDALSRAVGALLLSRSRATTPALVVIDPGDLDRAHRQASDEPDDLRRLDRVGALRALDGIVARARLRLPADAVLVVAAPVAAEPAVDPSGFGPVIVYGRGWSGYLTSASTHRTGLVTSADLTAGILSMLGIRAPVSVAGAPLRHVSGPAGTVRLTALETQDGFMRAVDGVRGAVVNGFILAIVAALATCLALAQVRGTTASAARYGQLALLAVATIPAASLLMYVTQALPQSQRLVVGTLVGTAAILWVLGVATHYTDNRPRGLAFLALLTALIAVVDQWIGAPLSLDGLFSYSPLVGARYYGIGNEMAALLVGGALTGLALVFDTFAAEARRLPVSRRWGVPLVGAACIVSAAAPAFGANIGVAVWGVSAFALAWWGMLGRKVTWRTVLVMLLAIVLLVGVFAAVDLLGLGPRTHLGRSLVTAAQGGHGQLATIVARKAATNTRILLSTSWSVLFLVLAGVLAYVRLRPRGAFRDVLLERPNLAVTLTAIMIAAVISYFTEDSGIVVPALLLFFPTVAVVYMMLATRIAGGAGR